MLQAAGRKSTVVCMPSWRSRRPLLHTAAPHGTASLALGGAVAPIGPCGLLVRAVAFGTKETGSRMVPQAHRYG